jgi:hypothetical protein
MSSFPQAPELGGCVVAACPIGGLWQHAPVGWSGYSGGGANGNSSVLLARFSAGKGSTLAAAVVV